MLLRYLKHTIYNKIDSYLKYKGAFKMNQYNNTLQMGKGLIVIEKEMVEQSSNTVHLKHDTSQLYIYPYDKGVYNILKELFPTKKICEINFQYNKSFTLDFTDFNSIQDTYNILHKQGYSIQNDKELIDIATHKLIPRKRLIIMKQKLGKKAFEGSTVRQYELEVLKCLDIDLIYQINVI